MRIINPNKQKISVQWRSDDAFDLFEEESVLEESLSLESLSVSFFDLDLDIT